MCASAWRASQETQAEQLPSDPRTVESMGRAKKCERGAVGMTGGEAATDPRCASRSACTQQQNPKAIEPRRHDHRRPEAGPALPRLSSAPSLRGLEITVGLPRCAVRFPREFLASRVVAPQGANANAARQGGSTQNERQLQAGGADCLVRLQQACCIPAAMDTERVEEQPRTGWTDSPSRRSDCCVGARRLGVRMHARSSARSAVAAFLAVLSSPLGAGVMSMEIARTVDRIGAGW